MRKQLRPDAPEALKLKGNNFNAQWVKLREKNPSAKFAWYTYQGKDVRESILPHLKNMTQGHCSFCDAFPLDVGNKQVEHFRPKTDPKFYTLAYSWQNLYLICTTCNTSFKQTTFHDTLLAPDKEDYQCNRYFYFDTTTGEMRPHFSATTKDKGRARMTIDIYGLNASERSSMRKREARFWLQNQTSNEPLDINEFAYRDFLESHATQPNSAKSFLEIMKETNEKNND